MTEGSIADEGEISTYQIIEQNARFGLDFQRDDGSFPPGENYPYNQPVTPVRQTAVWARILTKAHIITGEQEFAGAANRCLDYLLNDEARPHGHTFHCRNVDDKCNGLVGQARAIEALVYAGERLDRADAIETAKEVFLLHPFSERLGLWKRIEIDGTNLSFDRTLNHQITFAFAAAMLADELSDARNRVSRFLNTFESNAKVSSGGHVRHYVDSPVTNLIGSGISNLLLNKVLLPFYSFSKSFTAKEIGYMTAIALSLSRIEVKMPSNELWRREVYRSIIEFVNEHIDDIIKGQGSEYGPPCPAISIAEIFHNSSIKTPSPEEIIGLNRYEIENLASNLGGGESTSRVIKKYRVALLINLPDLKI